MHDPMLINCSSRHIAPLTGFDQTLFTAGVQLSPMVIKCPSPTDHAINQQ
jgi:hypothetical protein